jgi:hypothetical protein
VVDWVAVVASEVVAVEFFNIPTKDQSFWSVANNDALFFGYFGQAPPNTESSGIVFRYSSNLHLANSCNRRIVQSLEFHYFPILLRPEISAQVMRLSCLAKTE